MTALFITLDILEISKMGLNINEYLTLMKFHHNLEGRSFPFEPDVRCYAKLVEKEFIEVDEPTQSAKLTEKGLKIFVNNEDLFEEFYSTFPNKVPVGTGYRPVSAVNIEGMSAKSTRSIWDRITKGKPYLQRKIIDSLKKELAHRNATGTLGYLHNIDTWLRQATWEKWEDIPDNKSSSSNVIKI